MKFEKKRFKNENMEKMKPWNIGTGPTYEGEFVGEPGTGYAANTSGNNNHPKHDGDLDYDHVARYGRAPDQNKYRDVMDYVFSVNLIPLELCDKILDILAENEELWENHNWYEMIKDTPQAQYAAPSDQAIPPKVECMMMYPGINYFDAPANIELEKKLDDLLMPIIDKAICMYEDKFSHVEMDNSGLPTPLGNHIFDIRYQRYPVGTMMKIHYDQNHSLFHSCDDSDKAVPSLTICGYLTKQGEDFEGGDVRIRGEKIPANKGDICIFPSSFMYPHEVTPITNTMGRTRTMFSSWFW